MTLKVVIYTSRHDDIHKQDAMWPAMYSSDSILNCEGSFLQNPTTEWQCLLKCYFSVVVDIWIVIWQCKNVTIN